MMCAAGIGWIGRRGQGRVRQRFEEVWPAPDRYEDCLASPPRGSEFRNYGRFDRMTRLVCHAVDLALSDAGYMGERRVPEGTGLIGTGDLGTLPVNTAYFRDYCQNGKILARGNLFLYTLSTSPLAEAAIHYGLRGPVFFATSADGDLTHAFSAAADIIEGAAASCMLLCEGMTDLTIVHVLERETGAEGSLQRTLNAAAVLRRKVAGEQDAGAPLERRDA